MSSSNWKIQNGLITACSYCGEQVGNKTKYCKACGKKEGRENILKQNIEILGELRAKGYCKNEVLLPKP